MLTRLTLVLFISSCLFSQTLEGIPEWFTNPPQTKGMKYAKGQGNEKMKAVLYGLEELAMTYESSVESRISNFSIKEGKSIKDTFTSSSEVVISESLLYNITDGKFILESRTTHFQKETGVDFDSELLDNFEIFIKLGYDNRSGSKAIFNYFGKEIGDELIERFEPVYQNTDENKIIEELERYGISFKFEQDKDGYYYTLLSVKQEVLDRVKK